MFSEKFDDPTKRNFAVTTQDLRNVEQAAEFREHWQWDKDDVLSVPLLVQSSLCDLGSDSKDSKEMILKD